MPLSMGAILVVDDRHRLRDRVEDVLVEDGFEVLGVDDAFEALVLLESRSDIRTVFAGGEIRETTEGLELTRLIRSRWPSIKLIMVSGREASVSFTEIRRRRFAH